MRHSRTRAALLCVAAVVSAAACERNLQFRPPERPVRIAAFGAPSAAVVSFPAATAATGYLVYVSSGATLVPESARVVACAAPPCTVDGLTPGIAYALAASVVDAVGESRLSATVHATPLTGGEILITRAWSLRQGEELGASVAGAGDVNADGFADIAAGDPGANTDSGRVFFFLGSAAGPENEPTQVFSGFSGSRFGTSIVPAGDVNDDGFGDLAIGSPAPGPGNGFASVYRGTPFALSNAPAWLGLSDESSGTSLAAADLNGDGLDDVIAGAPSATVGSDLLGRFDVYFGAGPASGTVYPAGRTVFGEEHGAGFGQSLAVPDLDADGRADLVVGSPFAGGSVAGEIRVYLNSSSGLGTADTIATLVTSGSFGQFGSAIATATNVFGDGRDDLLVSAPGASGPGTPQGFGRVWLLRHGAGPGGLDPLPVFDFSGAAVDGNMGAALAGPGDLNGDGFGDLLVGEPGALGKRGRVHLFTGSPVGPAATPTLTYDGAQGEARFGAALAAAGDVNGDGFADFLVGAPGVSEISLYYGGRPSTGPRPDAGYALQGVAGAVVVPQGAAFVDEVPGRLYECTWIWGDGTETTVAECVTATVARDHVYTAPGTYDILLRVVAGDGSYGEAVTQAVIR